jgi:hypothetical protein
MLVDCVGVAGSVEPDTFGSRMTAVTTAPSSLADDGILARGDDGGEVSK